jgi:hypothetical protein
MSFQNNLLLNWHTFASRAAMTEDSFLSLQKSFLSVTIVFYLK